MTADPTSVDRPEGGKKPQLLLFSKAGRNRELLGEALGDDYRIETASDPDALTGTFDCCLLTDDQFPQVTETVERRRSETAVFLPFVLLTEERDVDPDVWEYVDDVFVLPVKKAGLATRIGNLVERRLAAHELAERERQLQQTVADLRLKEQAIDEAPVGFTIADARAEDVPLVYVNEEFQRMTGYTSEEVVGRNCRFLQGEETDPETVTTLREAIDDERPVSVDIINYRKNGEKFWNKVDITPLCNDEGEVTHFVGFQSNITDRKVEERRREVLNRVLSHNLRNKMNVIEAYLELLRSGDSPVREEVTKIEEAATNLQRLAETARETDRILSETDALETVINPEQRLHQLVDNIRDQYPDVTVELELPGEKVLPVATGGLFAALEEALDNAAKHNDRADPVVCVRVTNRNGQWVDIEVEDNGPGIPKQELDVLERGEEALRHADRMGIWLIYWTVTRAGGSMRVLDRDGGGTVLTLSVPAADA